MGLYPKPVYSTEGQQLLPILYDGTVTQLIPSGTANTTTALAAGVYELSFSTDVKYLIANTATAVTATTGSFLKAGVLKHVPIEAGQFLSVIKVEDDRGTITRAQ